MRYFVSQGHIAATETTERAQAHLNAGWHEVDRDTYLTAWRMRDLRAIYRLRVDAHREQMRLVEMAENARTTHARTYGVI